MDIINIYFLFFLFILFIIYYYLYIKGGKKKNKKEEKKEEKEEKEEKKNKKKNNKNKNKYKIISSSSPHESTQIDIKKNELFVDFIKGVNKSVIDFSIAPHAPLIASTTSEGKIYLLLNKKNIFFFSFFSDYFSCMDFFCKEKQEKNNSFLCAAMATEGRLVCFQISIEDDKITGMKEIHRSKNALQKGFVADLVASKGPWVITRSEGNDTEIRVHSYEGDLLASVDTKQINNLQLAVSDDGCLFGCAAWSPGVKLFEVKAKEGNFQKVEKVMDIASNIGSVSFCISFSKHFCCLLNKKGQLSLWSINVRYKAGEDTKIIREANLQLPDYNNTTLHFSRDDSVIIVVSGCSLYLLKTEDLTLINAIENITSQPIEKLIVAPNNKFMIISAKGLRPAILRLPLD